MLVERSKFELDKEWDSPDNWALRLAVDSVKKFGHIPTEVSQELYYQEKTAIQEGLNRNFKNIRTLEVFDGQVLWQGYPAVTSAEAHAQEAANVANVDNRYSFYAVRSEGDLMIAKAVDELMSDESRPVGSTITAFSPYPDEAEAWFGAKLVKTRNYRPDLRRGIIQIFRKSRAGEVETAATSVDNGGLEEFNHLFRKLNAEPPNRSDYFTHFPIFGLSDDINDYCQKLVDWHDEYLTEKSGGAGHYYGRKDSRGERRVNLEGAGEVHLNSHLKRLEYIAKSHVIGINEDTKSMAASMLEQSLHGQFLISESEHRDMLLNVIATDFRMIDSRVAALMTRVSLVDAWANYKILLDEDRDAVTLDIGSVSAPFSAATLAAERYDSMPGCGGSGRSLMSISQTELTSFIFGFSWTREYAFTKYMFCVDCQSPPKRDKNTGRIIEKPKFCGPCGLCRACDILYRSKA